MHIYIYIYIYYQETKAFNVDVLPESQAVAVLQQRAEMWNTASHHSCLY